ncbi:MAG: response regulator, partial [Chloroflexi bacterium]|nr:response regulator [Chloroflexota bacterium]
MEEKIRIDEQTMALRVAREFEDGMVVNLGIGVPCLAANYIPGDREVIFHAEQGLLGFGLICTAGQGDYNYINAGGQPVEKHPGMCVMDHAESFALIRGGFLDCTVLGGLQVSEKGDLANWMVPKRQSGTIGGAMDLALAAKKVIVVMPHALKDGGYKIVKECTYPLTGRRCVDLVVTDIAMPDIDGLRLLEIINQKALGVGVVFVTAGSNTE